MALFALGGCATTSTSKKSPQEMSQLYTELGTNALLRGEYSQAIEDLRMALRHNDKNAIAHNHLGLAYLGLSQRDLARKSINRAVEIDPLLSDAWINRGNLSLGENKPNEARKDFKKALENLEYRYRHRALTSLAQLELSQNNTDAARELIYQSIAYNPDYCLSHFLMGSIMLRDKNPTRASDEFKKSVKSNCVENPEGHLQLGVAYMQLKEFDKARKTFVYVLEQFPSTAQAKQAGEQLRVMP